MKIEHIALYVSDLEKMKSFYTKYFEATSNEKYVNEKKRFSSYFLTFEGGSRLELMHKFSVQPHPNHSDEHLGLIHFAISVGSKNHVDELTERVRQDGYSIIGEPRMTGDGYYESVILDPEGNQIEITI